MNIEQYVHDLLEFVRTHQSWAPLVILVLAFGESLAFISLLLPAWAVLVGMGALIGAGSLNFWPVWVGASVGAALGDWLSYWLGGKFERRLEHMWPLNRHPTLLPRGEAFLAAWGVPAIFIGRFFGPLRASIPLVAGIFQMPYWRFQIANWLSAFVWAAVILLLGDVIQTLIGKVWSR